jgi:hypothetical protein
LIEYTLVEFIQTNLNATKLWKFNYKKNVNLPCHVIHVTKIEMKVDYKKQFKTIQGSHSYNNLIDHIKRYCCRVNKHKPKPQNPILFFVCLLH